MARAKTSESARLLGSGASATLSTFLGGFSAKGGTGAAGIGGTQSREPASRHRPLRRNSDECPEARFRSLQLARVSTSGTALRSIISAINVLDANDWFNTSVMPSLPKAEECHTDFGGETACPIIKDRTFFFFSYEGLRLRLPQTALSRCS